MGTKHNIVNNSTVFTAGSTGQNTSQQHQLDKNKTLSRTAQSSLLDQMDKNKILPSSLTMHVICWYMYQQLFLSVCLPLLSHDHTCELFAYLIVLCLHLPHNAPFSSWHLFFRVSFPTLLDSECHLLSLLYVSVSSFFPDSRASFPILLWSQSYSPQTSSMVPELLYLH